MSAKRPRRRAVELDPKLHRANKAYGRRWKAISDVVLRRAGFRCEIRLPGVCTTVADVADHIVPVDEGGPSILENAQAACRACNAAKGYLRRMELAGTPPASSASKFPPRNSSNECPHQAADGSWCPGEDGHWSRWWVGSPEDPHPVEGPDERRPQWYRDIQARKHRES
jgi:HNH endonuclease